MTLPKAPPLHSRLLHVLSYEPNSGHFYWRVNRQGQARAGMRAGNSSDRRYVSIEIDQERYWAHRLAWFYMTKDWPVLVDHIDGDGLNNRFTNLRPASKSTNAVNAKISTANTSGHRGVSFCNRLQKWIAKIKVNGKERYLGSFLDKADAADAYAIAAKDIFGDFRR